METETTQLKVMNARGEQAGTREASASVFNRKLNAGLLHEVVRWQRAGWRSGTHSCLTRAEASGGGAKPWRQKGTGRARSGSNTSPLWVGGGVAHGPHPRSYEFSLNRKQRKAALSQAISALRSEGRLMVVEDFGLSEIKTNRAAAVLTSLGIGQGESVLVVVAGDDRTTIRSLRNIAGVKILPPEGLNVYDVLDHRWLLLVGGAVDALERRLG